MSSNQKSHVREYMRKFYEAYGPEIEEAIAKRKGTKNKEQMQMTDGRDSKGRFTEGNQGGGRKRLLPRDFHEKLKENASAALDEIIAIMQDKNNKAELRLKAACFIVENAFGKSMQDEQAADIKRAYQERKQKYLEEHPGADTEQPLTMWSDNPQEIMEEAIL